MKTTIIILLFSVIATIQVGAQNSPTDDREIQVEKKYNNEIYEVEPIFDFASISTAPRRAITFTRDSLVGIAPYTPAVNISIRPVAYKNSPQERLHKGFVKLDKGTTNLYHGQGGYVYTAANYFNIKADASYDQWQDNNIRDQNIKEINGSLGMTYYLTNAIKADLQLGYNKNQYGLYGGQVEPTEATDAKHSYNNYSVQLGLNSFRSAPAKWNYGLTLGVDKWNDNNSDETENNFTINGKASFNPSKFTTITLAPNLIISQSEIAGNATVIGSSLGVSFNTARAYITLGANAARVDGQLELWPEANLNWDINANHQLQITSAQTTTALGAAYISKINPYRNTSAFDRDVPLRPDYKAVQISKNVTAQHQLNLNESTTVALKSGFSIVNNDLNLDNKLNTNIGVAYQHFINESTTLLHRPKLLVSTGISYHPIEKLSLGLSGLFNSPQSFEAESITDSGWKANVSFEAKYDVLDRISIYLNADNIANNRYQVWNGYNSFGRNLSGGILVKF